MTTSKGNTKLGYLLRDYLGDTKLITKIGGCLQ